MKPTSYWWLSFADGTGNLGCCIVEATDFLHAVHVSHMRGCNPGGECQGFELPTGLPETEAEVAKWGTNRLLTREEMIADGHVVRVSDGKPVQPKAYDSPTEGGRTGV